MNYFTSPSAVRTLFIAGGFLFVLSFLAFIYVFLRLRRSIAVEARSQAPHALLTPDGLAFAAFQQTIADLKHRQQELETKARAETERAKHAESLTRSLFENLSSPAIAFSPVGLVRQANSAACNLFGYASPVGLSISNLFASFSFVPPQTAHDAVTSVPEIVEHGLCGPAPLRNLRITRRSGPAAVQTVLEMTILPGNAGGFVLLAPVPVDGPCTDEVPPPAENPPSSTLNER